MATLLLTLQGIRIHAGFYRDQMDWHLDPADTYVMDESGHLIGEIDNTDRLGEIDAAGHFRSLRCLAEQAANDDVIAAWERDLRHAEQQGRSPVE